MAVDTSNTVADITALVNDYNACIVEIRDLQARLEAAGEPDADLLAQIALLRDQLAAAGNPDAPYIAQIAALQERIRILEEAANPPPPPPPVDPPPPPPSTAQPTASNTGPRIAMTASGSITTTAAGQVISGKNISGTVNINHDNCRLVDCRVATGAFNMVYIKPGVKGTIVEYCEIDGTGAGQNGINGVGTFRFNKILDTENAINVTGNNAPVWDGWATRIQNNYIPNLAGNSGSHYDNIQIDGSVSNVLIEYNYINNPFGQTSCVMIDNYYGPIANILVQLNWLGGGGYTVYSDGNFNNNAMTGVVFRGNTFFKKGGYGYGLVRGSGSASVVWTDNKTSAGVVIPKP